MTCGVTKDRCEKEFGKCLKAHCKATYPGDGECTQTADTFVMGVKMFGCQGYLGSQEEGCDCVASEEAPARYRAYIEAFYAVYNKSRVEEIGSLMQKYSGKEGQLVYQLYKKYPEVIE